MIPLPQMSWSFPCLESLNSESQFLNAHNMYKKIKLTLISYHGILYSDLDYG